MNKIEFGTDWTKFVNAFTAAAKGLALTVSSDSSSISVYKGSTLIMKANKMIESGLLLLYLDSSGFNVMSSLGAYSGWFSIYDSPWSNSLYGFPVSYVMTIGKTIALGHSSKSPVPAFYIGETNNGNIGIIGMRNGGYGVPQFSKAQMLTYNMVKAPQPYDLRSWGTLSEMSAMVNLTIPGSTEGEYFKDIYLLLSRETLTAGQIKLNGKIFYSAGYIAVLDDDSGGITPTVPAKSPGIAPFNFYNEAGQFGDVTTGFAEGVYTSISSNPNPGGTSVSDNHITFSNYGGNYTYVFKTPFVNTGYRLALFTAKAVGGRTSAYNTCSVRLYTAWNESKQTDVNPGGSDLIASAMFTNYANTIYSFTGTKVLNISKSSIGKPIYIAFHRCDTPLEIYGITFI